MDFRLQPSRIAKECLTIPGTNVELSEDQPRMERYQRVFVWMMAEVSEIRSISCRPETRKTNVTTKVLRTPGRQN